MSAFVPIGLRGWRALALFVAWWCCATVGAAQVASNGGAASAAGSTHAGSATVAGSAHLLVRAHLEPAGPVVAGSTVKLVVDCLTTTWFDEAPDWPLFDVRGAIVTLPDEEAVNLHETIDGVGWFGVSRAYRITPQVAGTLSIPSVAIPLHPGGAGAPVVLDTPSFTLTSTVPPGAEGMRVFFPTSNLTATQSVTPALRDLRVGDMVTRTITQRATATESMLIPPVQFGDIDGLRRYPKSPSTHDVVQDRAGLVAGERIDTVTYLVDRSGHYRLPPVTIEWWNSTTGRRETIVLPALTFSAASASEKPLFGIPADAMSRGAAHRIIYIGGRPLFLMLALIACGGGLIWIWPSLAGYAARLHRRTRAARSRYAQSAWPAWFALRRAARHGSLAAMIPALYRWMDRRSAQRHPSMLDQHAPESLRSVIAAHYANVSKETVAEMKTPTWRDVRRALRAQERADAVRQAAQNDTLPRLNRF